MACRYAARLQCSEQRVVEMQTGSGRRDSARLRGVDRLIASGIGVIGRACDVRRQRDFAVGVEQRFDGARVLAAFGIEPQTEEAVVAIDDLQSKLADRDAAAGFRCMAGANLRERLVRSEQPLDQNLDQAAGILAAMQTCPNDPRVVEDEQVAGIEQRRQIPDHAICTCFTDDEQPARAALGRGRLRDQLGGQLEIEVGQPVPALVVHVLEANREFNDNSARAAA